MFKISERHWAWLGRLAIIVTLLGAPTIFLTLCHRSPTASLVAKVDYGAFSLPDDIERAEKALEEAISSTSLAEQLRRKFPDEKAHLDSFAYEISSDPEGESLEISSRGCQVRKDLGPWLL